MIGFTLIEIVAALAVAGALIGGILLARQRLMRSAREAEVVAKANVLAGQVVADWRTGRMAIETNETKRDIDQNSGLRWRARCERDESGGGVFLKRLRVRVFREANELRGQPLVQLEAWEPLSELDSQSLTGGEAR